MIVGIILSSCNQKDESKFHQLKGPYLGQTHPGKIPELFAPGTISTMYHEHSSPTFSPDGKEVFWLTYPPGNYIYRYPGRILYMKSVNDIWTAPEYASFTSGLECGEAFFSYDGRKVFFSAEKQITTKDGKLTKDQDIFITEKTSSGWSAPVNIGEPVATNRIEYQPTVTENLSLYYMGYLEGVGNNYGIFRSKYIDDKYTEPEALPGSINSSAVDWTPFIARDESYLLWSSTRKGGYGNGDLYVSFRRNDDTWTEAINLGPTINERFNERYPSVSPDGKYLFYITDKISKKLENNKEMTFHEVNDVYHKPGNGWSDVYWVDAKVIEELKPKNQGNQNED